MAKKKVNRSKKKQINQLGDRIRHEMIGILIVGLSCFALIALFSNQTGLLGAKIRSGLSLIAGDGRIFIPIMLGAWGVAYINHRHKALGWRIAGALMLWLVLLGLLHLQLPDFSQLSRTEILAAGKEGRGGGMVGGVFSYMLSAAVGVAGSYVILAMGAIIGAVLLINRSFVDGMKEFRDMGDRTGEWLKDHAHDFAEVLKANRDTDEESEEAVQSPPLQGRKGKGAAAPVEIKKSRRKLKDAVPEETVPEENGAEGIIAPEDFITHRPLVIHTHVDQNEQEDNGKDGYDGYKEENGNTDLMKGIELPSGQLAFQTMVDEGSGEEGQATEEKNGIKPPGTLTGTPVSRQVQGDQGYIIPATSLLHKSLRVKNPRLNKDLTDNVRTLEETLDSFGVKVKVTQVTQGPAITRYEAQPAPGVKVSKITNLADDIALSLAASDVRIEAPVPGKSVVGIEVPNKEVATVHFREVIESPDFANFSGKLSLALGKDISGAPIIADLAKMPHLLIAGATGSGKSVCINTLIQSILFKATPDEVKFLMVDPKMVELANYNGIPHLIAPVVTDPKKAAGALKWIVTEMETRYELFAGSGVRDIVRYNFLRSQSKDPAEHPPLPYVIVIIDELADLMMVAPGDVEDAICRLAQMARAAGIHLIVATQRPSVDVITGLIKANVPSRIAFAVSSQVDSRTILDMNGAEKLLGRGDMLFYPMGASKPMRVQGCFLGDKEVDNVVKFLQKQAKPEYQEIPDITSNVASNEEELDDLFYAAAQLFIESNTASVSMLQRRMRIGYTRAARLMDLLEEKGVVGPYEGSKPREVLLTPGQFETKFGHWNHKEAN